MPLNLPAYTTNVQLYAHVPAIEVPNIINGMANDFKLYMNASVGSLETHINDTIEPSLNDFKNSILNDISQFAISSTAYSTTDTNSIIAGADGSTYAVDAQGNITSATDGISTTNNIVYDVSDRIVSYTVTILKNGLSSVYNYTVSYSVDDIPTITLV